MLRLAFALTVIVVTASAVDAATASWDPNPETNIAGYKLSYGTEPGVHGTTVDVGNVTTFQFNPPPGKRYYVVVQAYSSTGELSAKSAEATIDIPATTSLNRAPTLEQPANQSSLQNATVSLAMSASDPDGNLLNYQSTGLPPGLSLNAVSGVIAGVVSSTGTYPVTVTVSDGTLTASRSFTWTVTAPPTAAVNLAPTLAQPPEQTTALNSAASLALSASDPEGKALSYTATGLPPGLSLSATSGIITGAGSQAGSYNVTVTVSDGALSASRAFKWTVTDAASTVTPTPNRAPSLNNVPDQRDKPNASASLQLRGSDPDGTPVTYNASGLPPGLSVNVTSGLISGVVSAAGVYQVTVTVSDGALSASRSFTWTVSATNGKNVVSTSDPNQDSGDAEPVVPETTAQESQDDARVRFQSAGRLSGVTALHDGRLLLIENDRSLSVLEPGKPVSQTILADSDARHAFSEVAVNTRFPATHHVFVGVVRRLDETTSDFAVVRYREVNGNLGEGAAIVSGLRFSGAGTPRFVVDDDARVYVAMPETDRSDIYSAGILRFDADGSVPKENRAASPLWAVGFSQPATLGFHGPSLVATGADRRWSYPAAQINPASPAKEWPQTLEPVSLGSSASVIAAAFGSSSTESSGLRAFVDSSGRLFRLSVDSRSFENVAIPEGLTPVSAAAGFEGQIYLIAGAGTGEFVLLEFPKGRN